MTAERVATASIPAARPPRVVLDSSVLVPTWSRWLLVALARGQPSPYIPVWCEWIIAETWRVLTVRSLRRRPLITPADERRLSDAANTMLLALLQVTDFVSVVPPFEAAWLTATDPNDRAIWSAAVRGGASFVISHNLRDFPPRDANGYCAYQGVEFITAENFVVEVLRLAIDEVAPYPVPDQGRVRHRRRAP